ncbi:MAG TPA: STAS domain-containing protein [Roseiflexaceae bacterium]|nr:STAS domain-containing protein [Roseiflexaceae bacterium]
MNERLQAWLQAVESRNPLEKQQAHLVQTLLLVMMGVSIAASPIPLFSLPFSQALAVIALLIVELPLYIIALTLLRRGRLSYAVLLTTASMVLLCVSLLAATGTRGSGSTVFAFSLPIVFAGLLTGRRGVFWSVGLALLGILVVMLLEQAGNPLIGFAAPRDSNLIGVMSGFVAIATVLGVIVTRFSRALRDALHDALAREREIVEQRDSLEIIVSERTADLRNALGEVKTRAAVQADLLAELTQQRVTIRELSVPILPVDRRTIVLPLVGALDDERLATLQERALQAAETSSVDRLILDVSGVLLIDSQVAFGLLQTIRAARLLGVTVAIAGIRPEVAQAMVGLGLELDEVQAYRDLESALTHDH